MTPKCRDARSVRPQHTCLPSVNCRTHRPCVPKSLTEIQMFCNILTLYATKLRKSPLIRNQPWILATSVALPVWQRKKAIWYADEFGRINKTHYLRLCKSVTSDKIIKHADKTRHNIWIDLLNDAITIELKSSAVWDEAKVEQEEHSLRSVDDSFKKIIVLGEPTPIYRNEAGITTMSIYDFLLKENSLAL